MRNAPDRCNAYSEAHQEIFCTMGLLGYASSVSLRARGLGCVLSNLDAEVLPDKSFERALTIGHALEPVHLLAVAQEDERR